MYGNRRKPNPDYKLTKADIEGIEHASLTTCGGIILTLHNEGIFRPTRYMLERDIIKGTLVLDTLICEVKEHACIKLSYDSAGKDRALTKLKELSSQEHNGSKENTAEHYSPLGLLYMSKEIKPT